MSGALPPASPDLHAPHLARRMASWLYEGLLLCGVAFGAGLVAAVAAFLFDALAGTQHALDQRLLVQGFFFLVFALYFSWFWSKGQTLAMKTWRIRLVDRAGRPVTQRRALLRYLLSWIWVLPPLALLRPLGLSLAEVTVLTLGWILVWALLSRLHPQRQFWHDALAGTRLVNEAPPAQR